MFNKIFNFIFSGTVEEYNKKYNALLEDKLSLEREITSLNDKIEDLEEQLSPITEDNSYITFTIDNDLKIAVRSKVNKDIVPALINNDIIKAEDSGEVEILQTALVLIANESTEQIIMGVNNEN